MSLNSNCSQLLKNVISQGATITVRDHELYVTSSEPVDIATITTIRSIRDDIIEVWGERAAIREFDGGLTRAEAERRACRDIGELEFDYECQ